MIVVDSIEQKPTLSVGITETNQFSIKNSAKAFHILSTSLYSNPRLAILRELGCNARDSHVEAGQTKPWRLHLPTVVNPMLEVEDFGVGLDHEQVMNLFTTFFESTKTNSNEFVGALGLGSKSPFSYTDNFTVVAIKNGTRNVYSAYKTDAGVPAIARMHTESTTSDNGVCIQIAIKQSDFSDFEQNAQNAFAFFDQLPSCNKHLTRATVKPFAPFGVDLGVEFYVGYQYASSVIMGGIAYKIDVNRKEFQPYGNLLSHKILLRANIGDVEMTPSREGLTYNKQTSDWIVSRLEDLTQKIQAELENKVAEYTSKWELAKFLIEQKKNHLYSSAVSNLIAKYFPNGFPVLSITKEELEKNEIVLSKYVVKSSGGKLKPKTQPTDVKISIDSYEFRNSTFRFMFDDSKVRVMDMLSCRSVPGTIFLFQSKNPNADKFIQKKLKETEYALVYSSATVSKVESEKRQKTDFFTFSTVEVGGYYNKRKVLKANRVNGEIPSHAQYWVPMHGVKVDVDQIANSNIKEEEVMMYIKHNTSSVIGFAKTSKSSKGKLVDLVSSMQADFNKELAYMKTPEGLLEAAIQYWTVNGYGNLPEFSPAELDQLDDKLLVKMIRAKKSQKESFRFLNRLHGMVPNFHSLYTQISKHVDTHYSAINFHSSYKNKVALTNFVFNNK